MKIGSMNNPPEIHRLASSIAALVAAITGIINAKVKEAIETGATADAVLQQQSSHPIAIERWVGKKELAEHFRISVRTTNNWMKGGLLPYIRIGRSVRFKLSEADETMNRHVKVRGR